MGVTVGVDRSQLQLNTGHNHQANTKSTTNQLYKSPNAQRHAGSGQKSSQSQAARSLEERKQSLSRLFKLGEEGRARFSWNESHPAAGRYNLEETPSPVCFLRERPRKMAQRRAAFIKRSLL